MTDSPSKVWVETPERRQALGAAWAEAGDWTVCVVFRDLGVTGHALILQHIWWRTEQKENPSSYQRDLQC